ncbi:MAG: CPBP family intramembrane metalloprotease [Deltaproteobacteria bacterium]|nr:CPBP family intramembrane metalloprotease [Deltaproteobacteria bacterium]
MKRAEEKINLATKPSIREALGAYLLVIIFLAVLTRLAFIPFIKDNMGGFAIIPFVYMPILLLRRKHEDLADYGISWKDTGHNIAIGLLVSLAVFPLFWAGYHVYAMWICNSHFSFRLPDDFWLKLVGNLLVVALPEEFFFRGYMQTITDRKWPKGIRILGGRIGKSALFVSIAFAALHLATDMQIFRLGVFFPSLVFCWLRSRTGSIIPGIVFHGLSNVFMNTLEASYQIAGLCIPFLTN